MKNSDKVIVIIPTNKNTIILCKAIESVINQTYKNIEKIIVDDNPPDSAERRITNSLMKHFEIDKRGIYIQKRYHRF